MSEYSEKLLNPKWQKKRLSILERDSFECQWCSDKENTLYVHHLIYEKGKEPWEYDNEVLITLCKDCHEREKKDREKTEKLLLQKLKLLSFSCEDLDEIYELLNSLPFRTNREKAIQMISSINAFLSDLTWDEIYGKK